MAELDPLFLDGLAANLSGQSERQTFAPLQAGVMDAGDLKVTPGAGARELIVAAGVGFPRGNNAGVLDQGLYRIRLDTPKSSTTFEAGGPTAAGVNPRLDQTVARVWDYAADGNSGVFRKWRLAVVPGAESAGVTLDNRTGAAALPANCLLLADVITRPGMTVYPAADIRDRRPWARGAYWRTVRTSGAAGTDDYTTTSAAGGDVDQTNLRPRLECSGAPLRMILRAGVANLTPGNAVRLGLGIDGVLQGGWPYHADQPSAQNIPGGFVFDALPAPGSHFIGPVWAVPNGGTGRLLARASVPFLVELTIEEIVRQNASNT